MEVCERNSCVCVTIATRDVFTGEEWLESLNVKGKITKVIDIPYSYKFLRNVYFTDVTNSAFSQFYFQGSQDFGII